MKKLFIALVVFGIVIAMHSIAFAIDDYPEEYKNYARDAKTDRWDFLNRECTSFCAWCLESRNGIAFHNRNYGGVHWGNAGNWINAAKAIGLRVDDICEVGAIACWTGSPGHVAWVSDVWTNNIWVEEYNFGSTGKYNTRNIITDPPSGYIHFPKAMTDRGQNALYKPGETVNLSLINASSYDSYVLRIYCTPLGEDTYLYWEGQTPPSSYPSTFSKEGWYSCNYTLYRGNATYTSEWVGWSVGNIQAIVNRGPESTYYVNEEVTIDLKPMKDAYDRCWLYIYRTPIDGETYLYWEGQMVSGLTKKIAFPQTGHYSCAYQFERDGSARTESDWVGWDVKEKRTLYENTLNLPSDLRIIESGAFIGVKNVNVVIPNSVSTIKDGAFESSIIIICGEGSAAEKYAKDHNIPFVNQ